MALRSRTEFPPRPGNFQYYQPETEWRSTPYIGFEPTVLEIQRHRLGNSRFPFATDLPTIRSELDAFVEADLRAILGSQADAWIAGPPSTAAPVPIWPPLRARAEAGKSAAGNVKAGIGLIRDFLGNTLKAVPRALAEKRAAICVTCPQNQKGGLVAHLGGEGLKLMLQARTDLKLETSFDDRLFDCAACECNLHLKPHVELAFILERTTPEVMAKLDRRCWILSHDGIK